LWTLKNSLFLQLTFQTQSCLDSFDKYRENQNLHLVYYFPTVSTPIAPLSFQKLKECPWEKGDKTIRLPSDNDIVIEESNEPDARINVCGFFALQGITLAKMKLNTNQN
jgi:hypothetical protein